jgi:hypothetical protein
MLSRLKMLAVILAGVGAGLLVVWKLQPDRRSDSQQVLEALVDMQHAVEEKRVGDFMRHVSESYKDSTVESKRELTRLVQSGWQERGAFHCDLQAGAPEIRGVEAKVNVTVDFSIERDGRVSTVKPFTVRTEWLKEKGGWRIVRAEGYMDAEPAFGETGW